MGKREDTLKSVLHAKFGEGVFIKPTFSSSVYQSEITEVYQSLGGKLTTYPVSFKGFDICCSDFIVELDEEQHFNRYRLLTLQSSIYSKRELFSKQSYGGYCVQGESICLKKASHGGYWSKPSSDIQFGTSGMVGDLEGQGSSRWKQRAFYDYLRDVGSLIGCYQLIRLSVYDQFNDVPLGIILDKQKENFFPFIIEHILQSIRTT